MTIRLEMTYPKTAIIFGVSGQDGSYLSELLLEKDYKVVGIIRRSSTNCQERIQHLSEDKNFNVIEGDITDSASVTGIINQYKPDEVYNLAAQSHVGTSFKQPALTFEVNAVGVLNILESIRQFSPKSKFYQASTSEMFGDKYTERKWYGSLIPEQDGTQRPLVVEKFQDEETSLSPRSPYAVAKVAAHNLVHTYRESYGLFCCCGILFNHESPRRGENFVTRKITKWIAEFEKWNFPLFEQGPTGRMMQVMDAQDNKNRLYNSAFDDTGFPKLRLGNLDAERDWGHAKDYVAGMVAMMQQDEPDDFVLATGKTWSIREFLDYAFAEIGVDDWEGYVVIDAAFYRPAEVEYLKGDASKALKTFGWTPKISFQQLVTEMVEYDMEKLSRPSVQEVS